MWLTALPHVCACTTHMSMAQGSQKTRLELLELVTKLKSNKHGHNDTRLSGKATLSQIHTHL